MAVFLHDESRTAEAAKGRSRTARLRRAKLMASLAVAALVGIGSYATTYHVLTVVSAPAPVVSVSPSSHTAMTLTPARPLP
jgi:hypothetical protein